MSRGTSYLADRPASRRRWWLVPVAMVLVLVLAQGVLDLRQRHRLEQLASIPGVQQPFGDTLGVRWTLPAHAYPLDLSTDAPVVGRGDVLVALTGDDGSVSVQSRAFDDGAVRWSTTLLPADEQRAANANFPANELSCTAMGDEPQVGCLVRDADVVVSSDGVQLNGIRSARLVLLNVRDGAVVAESELPDPSSASGPVASVDGLLVIGCGASSFCAWRPGEDQPRWTTDLGPAPGGAWWVQALPDGVARVTEGGVEVLGPDGSVVQTWEAPDSGGDGSGWLGSAPAIQAGVLAVTDYTTQSTLVIGPNVARTLEGSVVRATADDDSVPGLVVTVGIDGVMGWDVDSGRQRWRVDSGARSLVVLDGRAYVLGTNELVALNGTTGETLWEVPMEQEADILVTDGRVLLPLTSSGDGAEPAHFELVQPSDGSTVGRLTWTGISIWPGLHHLYSLGPGAGIAVLG